MSTTLTGSHSRPGCAAIQALRPPEAQTGAQPKPCAASVHVLHAQATLQPPARLLCQLSPIVQFCGYHFLGCLVCVAVLQLTFVHMIAYVFYVLSAFQDKVWAIW